MNLTGMLHLHLQTGKVLLGFGYRATNIRKRFDRYASSVFQVRKSFDRFVLRVMK